MRICFMKAGNWSNALCSLLVVAFLFHTSSLAAYMNSVTALPTNVQPDLLQFVDAQPDATAAVIIQKYAMDDAVDRFVERLGGTITKRLPIIQGVAAELSATQLTALARFPGVRWISLDAPVVSTTCPGCIDTGKLRNVYNQAIRVDKVWNEAPYLQGQGIGVAIVDSGIQRNHPDLKNQIVARTQTNLVSIGQDGFGHGSFVAGIVGGNGTIGQGAYVGVAPKTNLIDVRISTLSGISLESDVVAGLQWVFENRATYNIRVVNLSLNASAAQSYHTSALAAACEALWFSGVVVVTASGNSGEEALYPPANDPFVITVGATDDKGTVALSDDAVASFSAYGTTIDGFAKPDLVAPGRKIVAPLAQPIALLAVLHPTQVVNGSYIRMSGTSVSAPVVTGAVALLLQAEPNLTPDQVKYRLMETANKNWAGYDPAKAGAGYLDVYAAVQGTTTASANVGLSISEFLTTDHSDLLILRLTNGTVNWSSVNWSSVNWSSMNWGGDFWESEPVNLNLLGGLGNTLGGVTNTLGGLNLFGRSELAPADGEGIRVDEQNAEDAKLVNTVFLPIVVQNIGAE